MSHLLYEKDAGIAWLTLNRPNKRNAISPEMLVQLRNAWRDFRSDDEMRVAILTGAGDKAFCAGADLQRLIPLFTRTREAEDEWDEALLADPETLNVGLLRDFELYKPVIAAVNGFALAGGTEILQAADIRVACPEASFGLSEAKRGIIPAGGSLVRLQRQIPFAKAMEILLTGEAISAQEAHRVGLVNEIVPQKELLDRAKAVAQTIAENGPLAVQKIKEALLRTNGLPLAEAFAIESECARAVMGSKDAVEGPRAFMEKRKPAFTGH